MPYVVGMDPSDARDLIGDDVGGVLQSIVDVTDLDERGVVVEQTPDAGTRVDESTQVTVSVGSYVPPEPTPQATPWEPGSSEGYLDLATSNLDGPEGDLASWAAWFECVPVPDRPDPDKFFPCRIDTGQGPMDTIMLSFFDSSDEGDDASTAILAAALASGAVFDDLCDRLDAETVPIVPFAPGYSMGVIESDATADQRYATAEDVLASTSQASSAQGLSEREVTIDVVRC